MPLISSSSVSNVVACGFYRYGILDFYFDLCWVYRWEREVGEFSRCVRQNVWCLRRELIWLRLKPQLWRQGGRKCLQIIKIHAYNYEVISVIWVKTVLYAFINAYCSYSDHGIVHGFTLLMLIIYNIYLMNLLYSCHNEYNIHSLIIIIII